MDIRHTKWSHVVGAFFLILLGSFDTLAASPKFTLPFSDPDVFIRQGWLYDSPGPFVCPPIDGGDHCHKGIDYFKGSSGAWQSFDVLAAAEGWAIASRDTNFGLFVLVAHDETDSSGRRYFTLYAHLSNRKDAIPHINKTLMREYANTDDFSSWVRVGRGENIGVAGSDGATTNVIHLHLEAYRGGYALNKTDPYDIYGDYTAYNGDCGIDHLWMQCPPDFPSLFSDNFDDDSIDSSLWEYSGNTVSEINGELHVDVDVTDQGGRANTRLLVIDKNKPLTISRKFRVHAANQYFDGRLGVRVEGYPEYNFGVSYANYVYSDGYSCPAYGIAIYRNGANSHVCPDQVTDVSAFINPVWDTWFNEEVRYDPRTGELVYMINGQTEITYNVGILPEGADTIQIAFAPWGWWTGHYMHIDDFVVSQ